MTFIVEDGTMVVNSNALCSIAFASDYHESRGHGSWAAIDTPTQQLCIVRATDLLQKRFSRRWKGNKVSWSQSLDWPRLNIWDANRYVLATSNQIPIKIQQAVAEYALRAALYGELIPDSIPLVPRQDLSPADPVIPTTFVGGTITKETAQVDVIHDATTYQTAASLITAQKNKQNVSALVTDAFVPEYPAADLLLEDYMYSGSKRLARG